MVPTSKSYWCLVGSWGLGSIRIVPAKADLRLVFHDQGEEPAELVQFAADIGVEQGLVAFPAAPQHIVGAAQFVGQLQHILHLRRRIGEDVRVRVGRRPGHVAAVGEQVGGAPQQPHLLSLHFLGEDVADFAHIAVGFRQRGALRRNVAVVEAEERHTQQVEHLERHIGLETGMVHRLAKPGTFERGTAEGIGAGPGKGMPISDGEAQMVLHALAKYEPVGIVVAEGQRIGAVRPLVGDGVLAVEKAGTHGFMTSFRAG